MPESAFDEITARNREKHDHWENQTERCPHCGSFCSLESYGATQKGVCQQCGKAILRYRNIA
jgi:uncharacterized paraquat-inducible protein A